MSSVNDDKLENGITGQTDTFKEVNAKEIQVEDPVNFLNLQEKQEYMLAHQETLVRGEIPLDKLSDLPRPQVRQTERRESAYTENDQRKSARSQAYADRALDAVAAGRPEEEELRYRDYDERSGPEKVLDTAVKVGLVAIVILLLLLIFFLFLPSIKRAVGLNDGANQAGTAFTIFEEEAQAGELQATSEQGQQAGEATAENAQEKTVTVVADSLNLRDLPGWQDGSTVILKVGRGEKLTLISAEDGWLKVRYNGQEYYCSEEYVE